MEPEIELVVVLPVHNEAASVRDVILEWYEELVRHTQSFHFFVINDGSTDETAAILNRLNAANDNLSVVHQNNIGHGQTCLRGYRWALEHKAQWILQLDSDGQCDPRFFGEFWSRRNDSDVVYGKRIIRSDGWSRKFINWVLKVLLLVRSRVNCVDANVPYRLMKTRVLESALSRVPTDFHLANVALAVLLRRTPGVRHDHVPIHFRKRHGGQPSLRFPQFAFRARQLISQLKKLD